MAGWWLRGRQPKLTGAALAEFNAKHHRDPAGRFVKMLAGEIVDALLDAVDDRTARPRKATKPRAPRKAAPAKKAAPVRDAATAPARPVPEAADLTRELSQRYPDATAAEIAAKVRLARIDEARDRWRLFAEVEELVANGASADVLRVRIRTVAKRGKVPDSDRDRLLVAVDVGDVAAVARQLADSLGLRLEGRAGGVVAYDPDLHRVVGSPIPAGTPVRVMRSGGTWDPGDGPVRLGKADVKATKAAPAARSKPRAPRKARRPAADMVDSRRGHERLAAATVGRAAAEAFTDLDETTHAGASARAVEHRQRGIARRHPNLLPPDMVDELVAAGTSGDRDRVDATIERYAADYGLARVSAWAGQPDRYDPTRHQMMGDLSAPSPGTPVEVYRTGWALDDGDRVVLDRAVVWEPDPDARVEPFTPAAPSPLAAMAPDEIATAAREGRLSPVDAARRLRVLALVSRGSADYVGLGPDETVEPDVLRERQYRRAAADRLDRLAREVEKTPSALTGRRNAWWLDVTSDTDPRQPVPVRDLEIDVGGGEHVVVRRGSAHRQGGVAVLVDHDALTSFVTEEKVVREFFAQHREFQAATAEADRYQRAYTWLAGRNPNEAYWARTFGIPDLRAAATAGRGETIMWGRAGWVFGPGGDRYVLRHEFGHNVDTGVRDRPELAHLHARSPAWAAAARRDSAGYRLSSIVDYQPYGGLPMPELYPNPNRLFPDGVTDYGRNSPSEDFADSVMLYLMEARIGEGRLTPDAPRTWLYFRDLFPARAAILDQIFPDVAVRQRNLRREASER